MLNVVAALDSFKGALSSEEAGEAVRCGILKRYPDADVTVFAVGDGGEGTADALMRSLHAHTGTLTVSDTHGAPVPAVYGLYRPAIESRSTAILDMASAAGIRYAAAHDFDILRSTTYGVGEMIAALADMGADEIVVGLGGSGTSDGGIGALSALGAKFYEADGTLIDRCDTSALARVHACDLSPALERIKNIKLTLLSDTSVALTGTSGAVMMYSRQKGASEDMLPTLDAAMQNYAAVCDAAVGAAVSDYPGAGAAGGLGYGLSLIGGKLTPGAAYVLDTVGFTKAAQNADLIITGEGRTDRQTATGKLPMIVAQKSCGRPVICLCGVNDAVPALYDSGISAVFALADRPMTAEDSIAHTAELLEKAAYNIAGLYL